MSPSPAWTCTLATCPWQYVLVAIGLAAGLATSLPRAGVWMLRVKRGAAIVMFAMAEYYFVKMGQVW